MKSFLRFLIIYAAFVLAAFAGACMGVCLSGCTASIDSFNTSSNPSCQYQIYRHNQNGWLLSNPEAHLVFYGTQWQQDVAQENQIQTAWTVLFQNNVLQRLSEYGIRNGSMDPNFYNSQLNIDLDKKGNIITQPIMVDDSLITTSIYNDILSGLLPFPNSNTIYTVMLPPNVSTSQLISEGAVGHHRSGSYDGVDFTYSVIQYQNSNDFADDIIFHEIAESATDPDLINGYYGVDTNQEVGDLCTNLYEYIGGYQVQKVFSQETCTCL